jgi:hypothetical protein
MKSRLFAACVAITATAVGTGVLLGAGSASARPFGLVNCSARPQGTQVVTTCVNDDDAPGTGYLHAACTNGRILWPLPGYQVAPDSTQTFTEDCGPGGSPLTWEAEAQSQWQAQALWWQQQEQLEQLREQQESQR